MKTLVCVLFGGLNLFACSLSSMDHKLDSVKMSPCVEDNYRHKSEAEIAAMTPAQRIDEAVKEQLYHMPAAENYGFAIIGKYIRRDGVKIFPILAAHMNAYDPTRASKCEMMRFFVAHMTAENLDASIIRLRGTEEGRLAIEALEKAVQRMQEASMDDPKYGPLSDFDFTKSHLRMLKGVNISDGQIRDTLRVRHNVQLTDDELFAFSIFLTALDPKYPSWSEVGEVGPPMLLKDSKRYYDAYLEFKAKNHIR